MKMEQRQERRRAEEGMDWLSDREYAAGDFVRTWVREAGSSVVFRARFPVMSHSQIDSMTY